MTKQQYSLKKDNLVIHGKLFTSRLMLGTGKYKTLLDTQQSIEASLVK